MAEEKYLIYCAGGGAGLGHIFTSIFNCAELARRHNRRFGIDFRQFNYFSADKHHNVLKNFGFVFPPDLSYTLDIDEIAPLVARGAHYSRDFNRHQLNHGEYPDVGLVGTHLISDIYALKDKDASRPYRVELDGELKRAVDQKLSDFEWRPLMIGLHFRHGNGEGLDGRFDAVTLPSLKTIFQSVKDAFVDLAGDAAKAEPAERVGYYVAGDNQEFVDDVCARLPNAVSGARRPNKPFRDASFGRDLAALTDAVLDLSALSRCDRLIYAASLFPEFAALNSAKLLKDDVTIFTAPNLESILNSVSPFEAIRIANEALRRTDKNAPYTSIHVGRLLSDCHARAAKVTRDRAEWRNEALNRITLYHQLVGQTRELKFEAANATVDALTDAERKNPLVLLAAAAARRLNGKAPQAVDLLNETLTLDPEWPEALLEMYELQDFWFDDQDRASELLKRALAAEPDHPRALAYHRLRESRRFEGRTLSNVARGKSAAQSSLSQWSQSEDAARALNGVKHRGFNFHTERQTSPWWIADLGESYEIRALHVYNRLDYNRELARGLSIFLSEQPDAGWRFVHQAFDAFGGVDDGDPLVWTPAVPEFARYVKLQLPKTAYLHLNQVEVFGVARRA